MIESTGLTKSFGDIMAVNNVDMTIHEGTAFGLLGTNGAGKSTLLRMIAGILRQNSGSLTLDGSNIYENPAAKQQLFYIADNQYFFANTTPAEQGVFYSTHYPAFDKEGFSKLLKAFDLPAQRKVNTFSKGMKKQLSLLAGICANTTYLLCDETFDGLDPVMRQAVKSLMADAMAVRGLTPVIASHNLRELEDICDHVGLLHKGGLLLSKDLEEMRLTVHKLQVVFDKPLHQKNFPGMDIISEKERGRLQTMIIRGDREEIARRINSANPVFMELLPLTLEEVFITETEVVGYDLPDLGL